MIMVMVMVIMFRRRGETGIIGVFMHAVQKALDDAEGDEAADVDVGEVSAVLGVPLFDALALFEAGVEFDDGYAVDDLVGFFGAGCVGCCYCWWWCRWGYHRCLRVARVHLGRMVMDHRQKHRLLRLRSHHRCR